MATACSAAGEPSRSGTTIVAVRHHHVFNFKIDGYLNDAHGGRPCFMSRPFSAGGRTWHISYWPMGSSRALDNTDSISLYLVLDDVVDESVMAQASFSLLDQDGAPVEAYTYTTCRNNFSESKCREFGYEKFIRREDLERSGYLKDNSFAVRVQVFMVREAPSIVVPPPDMRRHIGDLLSSKEDADVKFQVGGETFEAHRLVLAARSPVFMAELLGPMTEGGADAIRVDDMEPRVFEAMLTFIYTDAWPEEAQMDDEEDACAMAQHLLVAADRYGLESLKSMCEEKLLSNHIDTSSAATILALAEQHYCCPGLKEACFEFLGSPAALLAVIETKGFEYLAQSCPSVVKELMDSVVLSHDLENVKVSREVACNLEDDAKVEEGVLEQQDL